MAEPSTQDVITMVSSPTSISAISHYPEVLQRERLSTAPEVTAKRRHNALAPVSRMPPELLYMIFMWSICDSWGTQVTLRAISYVCSFWREVLLHSPALWSQGIQYHLDRPEWVQEALSRSQKFLLDPVVEFSPELNASMTENVSLLLDHLPRIRNLSVCIPYSQFSTVMSKLRGVASALEQLKIDIPIEDDSHDDGHNPTWNPDLQAPNLRRLEIYFPVLSWQSPLFLAGLTDLRISWNAWPGESTTIPVLDILSKLPLLETLSLKHLFTGEESDLFPPGQTVNLPRLSHLELALDFPEHIQFLRRIAFPDTITFALHLCGGEHVPLVFDVFLPKLGCLVGANALSVLRCQMSDDYRQWEGWTDPEAEGTPKIALKLWWNQAVEPQHVSSEISYVRSKLSTGNIRTLSLASAMVNTPPMWIATCILSACMRLPTVRILRVDGDCGDIFTALDIRDNEGYSTTESNGNAHSHYFLHNLEELVVEGVSLSEISRSALRNFAHRRRELGLSLKRATFIDCVNVVMSGTESLKNLADVVEWDNEGVLSTASCSAGLTSESDVDMDSSDEGDVIMQG